MVPKAKGETSRALIVTLVFFVLATIAWGLGTYYGYAEVEKLKGVKAQAKKDVDLANQDRDAYLYLTAVLRHYVGIPPDPNSPAGQELADKAKYDAGQKAPTTEKHLVEF